MQNAQRLLHQLPKRLGVSLFALKLLGVAAMAFSVKLDPSKAESESNILIICVASWILEGFWVARDRAYIP